MAQRFLEGGGENSRISTRAGNVEAEKLDAARGCVYVRVGRELSFGLGRMCDGRRRASMSQETNVTDDIIRFSMYRFVAAALRFRRIYRRAPFFSTRSNLNLRD